MSPKSDLRPDLHRTQVKLDELRRKAVVVDKHGDAWQFGGMFWYRAFDGEGISSFQLAQIAQQITVLNPGESTTDLLGMRQI